MKAPSLSPTPHHQTIAQSRAYTKILSLHFQVGIGCRMSVCMYVCMSVSKRFSALSETRLHCFLSSHWPSFKFLSFMAFLIPSIQFFFGLPRALVYFGLHFNAILGNLPSAILWTWPYHVSWFCSVSFIIGSSNSICCLIVTFPVLTFLLAV